MLGMGLLCMDAVFLLQEDNWISFCVVFFLLFIYFFPPDWFSEQD